jgi:hypothetical protein
MADNVVRSAGPVGHATVKRLHRETALNGARDDRVESPAQAIDLDDVSGLNPLKAHARKITGVRADPSRNVVADTTRHEASRTRLRADIRRPVKLAVWPGITMRRSSSTE